MMISRCDLSGALEWVLRMREPNASRIQEVAAGFSPATESKTKRAIQRAILRAIQRGNHTARFESSLHEIKSPSADSTRYDSGRCPADVTFRADETTAGADLLLERSS
jgi:hypothetical protein